VPGYELLCLCCARHDDPGDVLAVSPDAAGWLPGVEALTPDAAVDLLASLGATVEVLP
jgi:hypothetical protein